MCFFLPVSFPGFGVRVRNVAQVVECPPSCLTCMKQVSIGSDPQKTRNLGIAAITYNSNTWEGKAGGSGVILGCISQPGLDRTLSQKTKQTCTHIHF